MVHTCFVVLYCLVSWRQKRGVFSRCVHVEISGGGTDK